LTLKNVAICPAAFNIVEEMKKKIPLIKWKYTDLKLIGGSCLSFMAPLSIR
jgi:hypothetical protein